MNPFPQTQAQRVQFWKSFDRQRWQFLRWAQSRVKSALDAQTQGVLDNLDSGISNALASVDATVREVPMREAFEDIYGKVGAYYAVRIFEGFKSAVPVMQAKEQHADRFLRFMREWIQVAGAERITQITSNTRDQLRQILQKGIQEGLSIDDIAKQITEGSKIAGRTRARVIARTEVISASNKGSIQGARATNLDLNKEWIATQDGRTRLEHASADGQVVGMDKPFNVGGEELDYPGDPSGTPGNVIQCRCTQGYQRK